MLRDMTLCEELFHTAGGVAYVVFITGGHRETWPIRSKRFRTWLRRCYYEATGAAAGAAAIGSALDLLEARAQFDAPERVVSIRVAQHEGRIYLDLADEHWRAVEIGPDGWRVLECPPVPSSNWRGRQSWAPCLMRRHKAYGLRAPFSSLACRGWPISRSGPRPAKQPSGPRAPSLAPTQPTGGPRLRASSRPTRSPLACGTS